METLLINNSEGRFLSLWVKVKEIVHLKINLIHFFLWNTKDEMCLSSANSVEVNGGQ